MNYVVLNGVKSTEINGLMIQSLPPISKPLMRTQIEQIDGRDGDIVTNLGYSAYDKTMTVGLYGDYNVDDAIQFFASQGTVVFSNEPDKFYNYQIINQIDFERLIRFKTATVTFHVQPFKYSAVDDVLSFSNNEIEVQDFSATGNGITLSAQNGVISLQGTATGAIDFYVPIKPTTLSAGDYTLEALTGGTGENNCSIRVVGLAPSDDDSFGGSDLPLQNDGMASMSATLSAPKTFRYIWVYVANGNFVDFTLNVSLSNDDIKSFPIFNRGNIDSRPKMTIYGSGTINLSINGVDLFTINLGNAKYITLDGAQMNAYQGEILMNRSVVGDYDNLRLKIGTNIISWTGNVNRIEVENFARWI